jgi:hypothetical protein
MAIDMTLSALPPAPSDSLSDLNVGAAESSRVGSATVWLTAVSVYLSRCDHCISISLCICVHHQDRRGQRRIGLSRHPSNLYLAAGGPSSIPVESVMESKYSPTFTPVRIDVLTDKATRGWFQSTAKCVCRCVRNHLYILCCFYVSEC